MLQGGVVHRASGPPAAALAVRGSTIVAVGTTDEIRSYVGPTTRVTELAGRSVVASLTDAHGHLAKLGQVSAQIDLRSCVSPEECADRVKKHAASHPGDSWLVGRGWDQTRFASRSFPTHASLDAAVADRPVWLVRVDGHAGWANAKALALAGVRPDTPTPEGGRIAVDAERRPTGVLVDAAMVLIERAIPDPTDADLEASILTAQQIAMQHGLTEVHDMGVDRQTAAAFRRLERDGRLKIRVHAFASAGGLRTALDEDELSRVLDEAPDVPSPARRFSLSGIKLWADGALGSRGAALASPYADDPGNTGNVGTPAALVERTARRALARGWQLAVHAIGDRANREVLDAFERAGCTRARDHRFRIEHAQIVSGEDIPRFQLLGVIASMQPTHATSDMSWVEARLGRERLGGAYAWRRFAAAGVPLALGSDFPVESANPLRGLFAAQTRTDDRGSPAGGWLPEQRLTFAETLRGYTTGAAHAAFEGAYRGDAEPGKVADLTVFDRPLDERAPSLLLETRVDLTAVSGEVVFQR